MSTAAQIAAQRLNAARAGLTGTTALPVNEPGAQHPATATEIADLLPTEFGGLTHLFGGEAPPNAQYEPVNVSRTIPAGSVAGKLGGLAPDVRNTATHAVESARANAKATAVPLSVAAKNTLTRVRAALKI